MVLVDEDIHREFRHIGGQSTVNGKNDYKGELPWQRFITQIKN